MRRLARVDLRASKAEIERSYAPGHPARLLFRTLPDELEVGAFDQLVPVLVRVLRTRGQGE